MWHKFSIISEFFRYLFDRRKFILFPVVFLLILLALLVFLTEINSIAPFIYTIF